MKKIENLDSLFTRNLKRIYDSEKQQLDAYPVLAGKVRTPELKKIIDKAVNVKKENLRSLRKSFNLIGIKPGRKDDTVTSDILKNSVDTVYNTNKPSVAEAATISEIQELSHHDISVFGSATAHANVLGYDQVGTLLHRSLNNEKKLDRELSKLAESQINYQAVNSSVKTVTGHN